jgi:hypothetical protein
LAREPDIPTPFILLVDRSVPKSLLLSAVKLPKKIRDWKAGELRVFIRQQEAVPAGIGEQGEQLYNLKLSSKLSQVCRAVPYGEGLALLEPTATEVLPGVLARFGVRDGRPQVVAIESAPDGPELTQTILRQIHLSEKALVEDLRLLVVRLELDERGDVIGVPAFSPRTAGDRLTFEERTADVAEQTAPLVRRRGRPRLSDSDLQRVAAVYLDAKARREPVIDAVASEFQITRDAAKKRIRAAREREFLEPTESQKARAKRAGGRKRG